MTTTTRTYRYTVHPTARLAVRYTFSRQNGGDCWYFVTGTDRRWHLTTASDLIARIDEALDYVGEPLDWDDDGNEVRSPGMVIYSALQDRVLAELQLTEATEALNDALADQRPY